MFDTHVLVRKGEIVKSGDYAELHNFAVEAFPDGQWDVIEYSEFSYFKAHPEEIRKLAGSGGNVFDNIASNVRNKTSLKFMQRPMRNRRKRLLEVALNQSYNPTRRR